MAKSVKRGKRRHTPVPRVVDVSVSEATTQWTGRRALTGWPMVVGWAAMLIFAFQACTHMVAAGDTWVAMACGRHFVHHGVDTVEPFSANSHKAGPTPEEIKTWPGWARWIAHTVGLKVVKACHPTGWIDQNWLTHVMFYLMVPKSSYASGVNFTSNALVYWKFAIYILAIICVYYTARFLGVNPALAAVFSCFALFAGRSFIDIRPAGFSNLLIAVFLLILVLTSYRNVRYIWLIVPVTVFWGNVHGGYIYVFIMLVPFVVLHALSSFSKKTFHSIGRKGIYQVMEAGAVALLAVIIFNPFHLTNLTHTFVISISKHAARWRDVHEWQPAFEWSNPVGTSFPFVVLYILSFGLMALWVFSRLLVPRFLEAPRNEIEAQRKQYRILSTLFGLTALVLGTWITFVSFSWLGLDPGSFLVCALFALILIWAIYKQVQVVSLLIPLILLSLWSGHSLAGYGGRYIYPFVIIPAYVILFIIASLISKTVKYKLWHIILVTGTAFVSLVLMMWIFNPFKFARPVWFVPQYFGLQRLLRPIYERNVGLSYAHLFDELYVVNLLAVLVWVAIPYLRNLPAWLAKATGSLKAEGSGQGPGEEPFQLPKVDLGIVAIAALTIYMAVRSRRFIPIAAITACPVAALLIQQMIRTFSAARNFHARNRLTVSAMPRGVQWFCIIAGAALVVWLGTAWTLKFKQVYLDPWPSDPKLNSVFMRMTASDAKPFYAMKFIRDNKLAGDMFNYWTEGGFIAWGQTPDPKTGRTPLHLFMDGRAQAAYNVSTFDLWSTIMAGGEVTREIYLRTEARGQSMTAADYTRIGRWMDKQMKDHHIWVVLMPAEVFATPGGGTSYYAIKGLEYSPNWRLVFYNRRQELFVDVTTPRGKELYDGIFTGKTLYPNEYDKDLILAHTYYLNFQDPTDAQKGFDYAIKAFNIEPSATAMLQIMAYGVRYIGLKPQVEKICAGYLQDFTQNKDKWSRQDGFRLKLEAARLACYHLKTVARARRETEEANRYAVQEDEYFDQIGTLAASKRW